MSDDVPIEGPGDTEALVIHDAEFVLEPGVGLTVMVDTKNQWLSWHETLQLIDWLDAILVQASSRRR